MSNPTGKGMEYVRFFYDLPHHPKTDNLRRYLETNGECSDEKIVVATILYLWRGVGRHFNDGIIRDQHDIGYRVAKLCEWTGDQKVLVEGLLHADWLHTHPEGFYVTNWREKIAFDWWKSHEKREHQRMLGAKRQKVLYDKRKAALDKLRNAELEIQTLRENFESKYDASPPPPSVTNADFALVKPNAKSGVSDPLGTVRKREVHSNADFALGNDQKNGDETKHEVSNFNEKHLDMSESQSSRYPNASLRVSDGTSRTMRREREVEKEEKDKDCTEPKNGSVPSHFSCIELFKRLYKTATGESLIQKSEGHLAAVVSGLAKPKDAYATVYTHAEIERRIPFWFESEYAKTQNYRISQFERKFPELKDGPLKVFEKQKRRSHGEFDKRAEQFETTDDFGIAVGPGSGVESTDKTGPSQ